jgi:hypothetical protein
MSLSFTLSEIIGECRDSYRWFSQPSEEATIDPTVIAAQAQATTESDHTHPEYDWTIHSADHKPA